MITGYKIKTFHNTVLCTSNGLVKHSKTPTDENCLYLFCFDNDNAIIIPKINIQKVIDHEADFLLFRYSKEFPVPAMFCITKIIDASKKKILLVHPKYRYLFSAVVLGVDSNEGIMKSNTYLDQNWEFFELIEPTLFDSKLDECISNFKLDYFPKSSDILQSINDNNYISFLNYMNLASYDELIKVAKNLLNNNMINKLSKMFSNDIFIQYLYSYIQQNNIYSYNDDFYINKFQNTNYKIDKEYDYLAELYASDISKSPTQLLLSYIRSLIKPSQPYTASVVTTIRNEGPYIVEFVAYYKSIGFDNIYVYSNNNNDNSDELLNLLAKYGYITYINNVIKDGCGPQRKAYMHAATLNFEILENDWTLFVDIDEFFTFNSSMYKDVKDYLMHMNRNNIDSICLNWVLVGANEKISYNENETTLDTYKKANQIAPLVKSFVRTNKIGSMHAHFPYSIERDALFSVHANGNVKKSYKYNQGTCARAYSDDLDINHASVVHYWTRSLYEFIHKYSKSRGDFPLNSAVVNFSGLDENLAKNFVSRFNVSPINLDNIIGENREKMKYYIKNNLYKHDEIAKVDIEIKKNFGKLTRASVTEFVSQFSNTNSDAYKRIIDLIISSGFSIQDEL